MTIRPTDDRITSDVTTHTATRCPGGWAVTWLGERTVDRNQAITAMLIAEEAQTASQGNLLSDATLKSCRLIDALARQLGMSGEQAIDMVRETLPSTYVHQALVSDDAPPRPWCGGVGRSVMRKAEVTCPDCLQLDTDRQARTEVHDAHAIPAGDEPVPADALVLPWQNPILIDKDGDHWQVVAWHADGDLTMPISKVRRDYGPLTVAGIEQPAPAEEIKPGDKFRDRDGVEWIVAEDGRLVSTEGPIDEDCDFSVPAALVERDHGPLVKVEPTSDAAAALARLGDVYAPIKTHDLWIERRDGNVVIKVENELEDHWIYLQNGVALDLGRVLAALTPDQIALLIDDLTGGAK